MVSLNISDEPNFVRPELLLHPPIPRALHGVNPRTIRGQEWWDKVRKETYAKNNFCCFACGTYQLNGEGPLHAHECYEYDYEKFEARMVEVVALCSQCHDFVHWRRIKGSRRLMEIVERGLAILTKAGLPLPEGQLRCCWLLRPGDVPYLGSSAQRKNWLALVSTEWKLIGGDIDGSVHNLRRR